ncbi:ATPase inhibitor subunit zeta [Beijerinckia mobilis]|uniref:ATPase inhibitor subunit zeta n=1 Tax=Beijerinckia mobilis TaxID=231434 RepID=UPI00055172C7|nr:ATPase inhibitor subunit zeta [Beijerinckia mobilis]
MTMFSDRERAYEQVFVNQQDEEFRRKTRRNRRFAQWVGRKLALSDKEEAIYVDNMVAYGVLQDDKSLIDKAWEDFQRAHLPVDKGDLARQLEMSQN